MEFVGSLPYSKQFNFVLCQMSPVRIFALFSNVVLYCKISKSASSLEFFRLETCINFSSSHSCYFPNPLNISWFYSSNNIRAIVQIMESLIVQCSSRLLASCGFSTIFPAAPCQSYSSSIHPFTKLITVWNKCSYLWSWTFIAARIWIYLWPSVFIAT
jgi:hypothetical protein